MLKVIVCIPTLYYMAAEFKPGEPAAIVFAATGKLIVDMGANEDYYVNDAKIAQHKHFFKKGFFEAPILLAGTRRLTWVEGFHQAAVAVDVGLPVVPVITTERFVAQTRQLVGATNAEHFKDLFDLSNCMDMSIHY